MNIKNLTKLLMLLLAFVLCATTMAACTTGDTNETTLEETTADSNEVKYIEALDLLEKGDYVGAYTLFTELGDYKDAAKMVARFHYTTASMIETYVDADGETVELVTLTYNENNLPATCVYKSEDGYQHTCTFTYTETFKLKRVFCTDTDGTEKYMEFAYDEKDNMTKEEVVTTDGIICTYIYTYNEKGYVATMTSSVSDGISYFIEYTYDENGNEILCLMSSGDMKVAYETAYDADGKKISETQKDANGNAIVEVLYTYDEKGRNTKETSIVFGEESSTIEYIYDDKDQLIHECHNIGDGIHTTYEYAYDEYGNMIRAYRMNSDNEERTREATFKLVYVPYDLTEEEWQEIMDRIIAW